MATGHKIAITLWLPVKNNGTTGRAIINQKLRILIGFGFAFLFLIASASLLFITESALSTWQQLQELPTWVMTTLFLVFGSLGLLCTWIILRLFFPRKSKTKQAASALDLNQEEALNERILKASEAGVDIEAVEDIIEDLKVRRAEGRIYISFFGEVNMGKSSIISAMLPDAKPSISAIGGSTTEIKHYVWKSKANDQLIISDVPGSAQANKFLSKELGLDEATRAHIVIYVCDGDLNRNQFQEINALLALNKPTIIALNKSDHYNDIELHKIKRKIRERLSNDYAKDITENNIGKNITKNAAKNVEHKAEKKVKNRDQGKLKNAPKNIVADIVSIQTNGTETVIRISPEGEEETLTLPTPPQVNALTKAVQLTIDNSAASLENLRDASVFVLAESYLNQAERDHKKQQAEEVVQQYTRKALIGAVAAVSPGTDIIVQAYLGTSMVKALCDIYEVPAREFDVDKFLKLIQSHVGKKFPIILAIIGNVFKAFPGIGTITGGLIHAVAYGLIFDTLGKSIIRTHESRGDIRPAVAAKVFQETLSEDLESRTKGFIKTALQAKRNFKKLQRNEA